ncbi:MAG: hypothetical protein QOC81_4160 [Thermoanaerobaculia bacterium]|jgi:enamine deaminase RidA (YjgF/YER057c/UK114 family)|nr:hypothetical protein [Thermoanaerobaculia bacterium]
MKINRLSASSPGRSRAVAFDRLVWVVANAQSGNADFAQQAAETLESLDSTLRQAGSLPEHLLSVQVFLADIATKGVFDDAWGKWIAATGAGWPQRVCIEAGLTAGLLIEIQAVAARVDEPVSS